MYSSSNNQNWNGCLQAEKIAYLSQIVNYADLMIEPWGKPAESNDTSAMADLRHENNRLVEVLRRLDLVR